MVRTRVGLWLVCATLLAGGSALAQNLGISRLTGTVKDAQGAVLPGVTVTATSPALIGNQVAVTEANGSFQFPALPPGTYTLKYELSGFQPLTRQNIVLAMTQTLTVDATLQLASLQENVIVTAEAPVVDTQSTAVGNTFSATKLTGVPSSTDLWAALAQSPGVRMQGFDVGGSHKSQQSGYDAFGITDQTRVITEGVDQTEGTGGAGFYQDFFSQNEIAVSGAGQDVEMNTPGAAVISTIKSGGNDFTTLINQTYEGESFVGDNVNDNITSRKGSASPNLLFWENHDDVGGPIVKDRLWFFAAFNHFHIDKVISGVPRSTATDVGIFNNFTTKETFKASSKDTLIGYYQWGRKQKPYRGLSSLRGPASTLAQDSASWDYNGKWDRIWNNRMFTELNVGLFGYDFPQRPSVDFKTQPPRSDLTTGRDSGAGFLTGGDTGPFDLARNKPQVYGKVTYYLPTKSAGSHDLKAGFEWIDDQSDFGSIGTSGPILYLDDNGATSQIRLTDLGDPDKLGDTWQTPSDRNRRVAGYFQDRWTASSKVTLTAGVRFDRQRPYYTASKRGPILTDFFPTVNTPAKTLLVRNSIAPRVGVSYDPAGDGRSVVKAFYGRYYFNFADSFSAVDPGGAAFKDYEFNDLNGNRLYDGPQELGALLDAQGGVSTTLDQNIILPHTDEFDLSYQRQFWGESSIRFAYVRKMTRDNFDTYNAARVGQFTVAHVIPVALSSVTGPEGTQSFTVYDIPDSLKGVANTVIATLPDDVDNGAENYDTFELAFNKRFSQGLFLDSSFDYTRRSDLRANTNSTNPLTQSDAIGKAYYQNVFPTVSNRQQTQVWGLHVSSRYQFPYEIGVGANLAVQSGWLYSRRITVSLPNAGNQNFWMTDLNQRSDAVPLLSFRVDKAFSFAGHRLTGMLDVFNILNNAAITNFNVRNGKTFNQIIQPLDPITMQLGIRFEF